MALILDFLGFQETVAFVFHQAFVCQETADITDYNINIVTFS
jgi:hypothetical protein